MESLGPAGSVVFVLTVMVFEMVPLFPTQPLSLAGGLLFGPIEASARIPPHAVTILLTMQCLLWALMILLVSEVIVTSDHNLPHTQY